MKNIPIHGLKGMRGMVLSLIVCLPFLLISYVMLGQGKVFRDPYKMISFYICFASINILFFQMVRTGVTSKYRKIFFVVYALLFIVSFMTTIIETRGSLALTEGNVIDGRTPFCHIAITAVLIPAALTKTIIFPGSLIQGWTGIATMFVIWIGASIALGRAWCSWACFYGGLDEGFSSLCRKPKISINRKWLLFPFAILAATALISAATLSPVYCEWLCPFKAVTEFQAVVNLKYAIAAAVFYGLFALLVVILPVLSGKRTQCALFCPFGAMQSITNKISLFEMRIDTVKCLKCGKCIRECPTLSLDMTGVNNGRPSMSCTKCGRCADVCPAGAVSFHIRGTRAGSRLNLSRILFLYATFVFASTIAGGAVVNGFARIMRFFATGSFF